MALSASSRVILPWYHGCLKWSFLATIETNFCRCGPSAVSRCIGYKKKEQQTSETSHGHYMTLHSSWQLRNQNEPQTTEKNIKQNNNVQNAKMISQPFSVQEEVYTEMNIVSSYDLLTFSCVAWTKWLILHSSWRDQLHLQHGNSKTRESIVSCNLMYSKRASTLKL